MQPENPATPNQVCIEPSSLNDSPSFHHGRHDRSVASPSPSQSDGHGGLQDSGSEWSVSTSPSPSDYDAWIGPGDALGHGSLSIDQQTSSRVVNGQTLSHKIGSPTISARGSRLLGCPSGSFTYHNHTDCHPDNAFVEVLLQVLSHLPATDLLTVKLLSRRFYSLVNSPHAWISAFAKYFPGPTILKYARVKAVGVADEEGLITEKRAFARISAVPSWTGEYLLRTKLLRCLLRGRPSLPFAAPSQRRPHKGYATFSFNSRLGTVTHLEANFGPIQDKRLPQFIHGSSITGAVSISDRRGELAGWGVTQNGAFLRTFSEIYPGTDLWGLGPGDIVGLPNVMDLDAQSGMIYGEGLPGGHLFYMAASDKRGKFLAPFLAIHEPELGVPRISPDLHSICSVWIAKSNSIPRVSKGLVGILAGSSCGVISSYSIGTPGGREERLGKGELTARWLVSPGVPIIKILADDRLTTERLGRSRIWAVAVNALGEIFHLTDLPSRAVELEGPAEQVERNIEFRAWQTGRTATWQLVPPSQRVHRPFTHEDRDAPTYFSKCTWSAAVPQPMVNIDEMKALQTWFSKSPLEIRSTFESWDMRRRVEVDFGGDDGNRGGQNVIVINCGDEEEPAAGPTLRRYTACSFSEDLSSSAATITLDPKPAEHHLEWRCSDLVFGRTARHQLITASAIDCSTYALTNADEDVALRDARVNGEQLAKQSAFSLEADTQSPFKVPGQRARFVGVGNSSGQIFLWNARGTISLSPTIVNELMPVRVIQTDSEQISALALTSFYLVHGGSDGLVQAWDPLASTLQPIRTICSALSRRALVAAQHDPNVVTRGLSAVGAICLDPEPGQLRGIVATRSNLRFWSYSSSTATKATPKSQKRRLHRNARGLNSSPADGLIGGRRAGLKDMVHEELISRGLDEQERRAEAREQRRVAGRFGVGLLGADASEEELIAYAKLLSEEEEENKLQRAMEKRLARDASEAEVEAHMKSLSLEDYERWKFASWAERFEMPTSGSTTVPPASPSLSPVRSATGIEYDVARAMELSLQDIGPRSPNPTAQASNSKDDNDLAEAMRQSLAMQRDSDGIVKSSLATPSAAHEDDMERAIRMSLMESDASKPSPTDSGRRSSNFDDEIDFPALSPSSRSTPPSSGGDWGSHKGKGKRRAW